MIRYIAPFYQKSIRHKLAASSYYWRMHLKSAKIWLLPMDKSRGFQGLLGRHGLYWRYFQKSGDVVFLFPFYSQNPLDFLNMAPDGTIRVEGSQLNLLVALSIC